MTRLIFTKNKEGNVYTTHEVLAREKVINGHVIVKDDGCHYLITDLGSGKLLAQGVERTVTMAKKVIKAKFKELGVVMHDEVRKKVE